MKIEVLTQLQEDFLGEIGRTPYLKNNFYLTGGTALAAFYLGHRYSEDLDFFSEKEVDMINLNASVTKLKKFPGVIKADFEQSYNRNLIFFHFKEIVLKTEFTFFPFPRIEDGEKQFGLHVDSLLDIAVNKLFTIYQRSTARDYIDLYLICKENKFEISDLIKKAKIKFDWHVDPLQLGTQFVKSAEAKDYPRMIIDIKPEEWQDFFLEKAKELKSEVLEF
jgi:predicted nucleotidyltransferase component of viral defense system